MGALLASGKHLSGEHHHFMRWAMFISVHRQIHACHLRFVSRQADFFFGSHHADLFCNRPAKKNAAAGLFLLLFQVFSPDINGCHQF